MVWSQLDRVTWKGSKALLENSEFLVGRIYRYFIDGGKARIRLAAFEEAEGGLEKRFDEDVRANDPLYLMRGTSRTRPLRHGTRIRPCSGKRPIEVGYQGKEPYYLLRYSVSRAAPGSKEATPRSVAMRPGTKAFRSSVPNANWR